MVNAERQFLIFGLPRTRTAWLANFFTSGEALCFHELSGRMGPAQIAETLRRGARFTGNSDSGALHFAPELIEAMPGARVVVIRRDIEEALSAYCSVSGMAPEGAIRETFRAFDEMLNRLEPEAHVVDFDDLDKATTVEAVWRHCLGEIPFPATRFEMLRLMNVQMEPAIVRRAGTGSFDLPGRAAPMNEKEAELVRLVLDAHAASALRQTKKGELNVSAASLSLAALGSGDYSKSIASALMTLGGPHAPLETTAELLEWDYPASGAREMVRRGQQVPGWGNSFVKGKPDPTWEGVDRWLAHNRRDLWVKLEDVTFALHELGKPVFPNPSAYTAAAAIALGIPARAAGFLFIAGRLCPWTQLYLNLVAK